MLVRVAINGLGRIGRLVLKAGIHEKRIKFVAVNDLADAETLAHLLKHDSVYGPWDEKVEVTKDGDLKINGRRIKVFSEKDPTKLPWGRNKIDIVVESTGIFCSKDLASLHLKAGAKKVVLSAPSKGEKFIKTIVMGVNDDTYDRYKDHIISNASCTTNCLAPIIKVLHDRFHIIKGFMTTIHSYTADQRLVDAPHKDLRRARAAALNIIPTTTGAAKAVTLTIPELKGKLDGIAIRVPTPCGSVTDFVGETSKLLTVEEVNKEIKKAADGKFKRIIQYSEEELVSTDILSNPHSAIFDSKMTKVIDNMVKVVIWYDNELGYSHRMIDMLKIMI
jgi:glyceraldehyde 3-phosphate dehydrogenase